MRAAFLTRFAAVALATVSLIGCGGSASPEDTFNAATQALQSGDHETALKNLNAVLADSSASKLHFRARRDSIACEAHVSGDEAAMKAYGDLKAKFKAKLNVDALAKIGDDVAASGCTETALAIITDATDMAGDDEAAKRSLEKLAGKIAAVGGDDALAALRALGYIGD